MSSSSSQLFLPPGTPFPINVVRIQARASDPVQRGSPLLTYSFTSRPSEPGGHTPILFGIWDCPVEGIIKRWCVKERDIITSDEKAVLYISEPCKHGVQMGGLCALCGKDMTQSDYTGFSNEARASIQMTHSANGPKVSLEEARRIEQETAEHLLNACKLSLIVDLDQTIVHATVDPTVGDWIAEGEAWEARHASKREPSKAENDSDKSSQDEDEVNPNWEALKDVKKFRLGPESFGLPPLPDKRRAKGKEKAVETQGCLYYVKPRPGWLGFLSSVATKYEMHVYTMGTRAYAEEVCKAIDPDGKFFGGRILSRDESGSLTQKSLRRLFPVDTSMVVIIDDRADVWEWSPNLVKVIPYDFFVGIGDINSTFLPKLDGPTSAIPQMSSKTPSQQPQPVSGSTPSTSDPVPVPDDSQQSTASTSSADEAVAKEILQKEMIALNSLALVAQVEERPLAKLQEELQEEANGQSASESPSSDSVSGQSEHTAKAPETPGEKQHRKALLKNDDTELQRVKRLLDVVHQQFFEAYDSRPPNKEGKAKSSSRAQPSSSILYDVRIIIPGLRLQTFDGLHILFSSVIPLDTRPESTDIWNLAEAFGASCHAEFSSKITHLVAAKRGTAKIDQARKQGNIKIVWLAWFTDSIARWERQDETPYLMDEPRSLSATAPDTASSPAPPDAQQISSDPEPDADDWDVEPGSRKGGSGTASPGVAAQGGGTVDEEELDDLKRISEESRNLELSLSWDDVDEELREFLASGDEDDEEVGDGDDDEGDDDDIASLKGRKSANTGENDRRVGGETGNSGSGASTPRTRRKRLRSLTPSEAGLNASDDDFLRSPLSKRKKLAKDRQNTSRLKESISPEEYALPTVAGPRGEDEEEEDESIFGDDDDSDDDDDDDDDDFLARELEEEMG